MLFTPGSPCHIRGRDVGHVGVMNSLGGHDGVRKYEGFVCGILRTGEVRMRLHGISLSSSQRKKRFFECLVRLLLGGERFPSSRIDSIDSVH